MILSLYEKKNKHFEGDNEQTTALAATQKHIVGS